MSEFPVAEKTYNIVNEARKTIKNILHGKDNRFLIIAGPCSVHDKNAVLEYAQKLLKAKLKFSDKFYFVMRLYFEKPRTSLGWRGLIVEPDCDGFINIEKGLKIAREITCEIAKTGLPLATEFLDPIVPQYISDLISWASVGARSAESQIHRELASGLPMPVGFKNTTTGEISASVNAIISSQKPHGFLGITDDGVSAIMHTTGNDAAHLVLRGGENNVNYKPQEIKNAVQVLQKNKLNAGLIIDCSHGNSHKKALEQKHVFHSILESRKNTFFAEHSFIRGAMLESFLKTGNINFQECKLPENYGFSITDECLGWDETFAILKQSYENFKVEN